MRKLVFPLLALLLLIGCQSKGAAPATPAHARVAPPPDSEVEKLGFALPPRAKYWVTKKDFAAAKAFLEQNLKPNARVPVATPAICGPGLWRLIARSPRFAGTKPLVGTCTVPMGNGDKQSFPMGMMQTDAETDCMADALADLLENEYPLTVRPPNAREFSVFWATTPFDVIAEPLLVVEGKNLCVLVKYASGKPSWWDEVKNMWLVGK